jgi:hypothetical protein
VETENGGRQISWKEAEEDVGQRVIVVCGKGVRRSYGVKVSVMKLAEVIGRFRVQ